MIVVLTPQPPGNVQVPRPYLKVIPSIVHICLCCSVKSMAVLCLQKAPIHASEQEGGLYIDTSFSWILIELPVYPTQTLYYVAPDFMFNYLMLPSTFAKERPHLFFLFPNMAAGIPYIHNMGNLIQWVRHGYSNSLNAECIFSHSAQMSRI